MRSWLALAASASAAVACELTLDTYAVPGCSVQLNSKTFAGSQEGQCTYAPNVDAYVVWKCGDQSVSVNYFSDAQCTKADGSSSVAAGECALDSKTGFYVRVGGDCCGLSDAPPMPGADGADAKHYRHSRMQDRLLKVFGRHQRHSEKPVPIEDGPGSEPMPGQDGHGTAPDQRRYSMVNHAQRALKKAQTTHSGQNDAQNAHETAPKQQRYNMLNRAERAFGKMKGNRAPRTGADGAGTEPVLGQDGHGTAPDQRRYNLVNHAQKSLNKMHAFHSADAKADRKARRNGKVRTVIDGAADRGVSALSKLGRRFVHSRPSLKTNSFSIQGRKERDGSFFAHKSPPFSGINQKQPHQQPPKDGQQQPPPPPPQKQQPQQPKGDQPPPQQRADGHYQA